ncbi:YncE family protein [Dyadobacter subterraneus]|uniref:Uncharacterized protein n=1 Tax=Dyadobacter subterraneus TaxID=2773304 RepID=A0ABR9WLS2_9BACT|nr:hypothetical protein [Dyadobacter subterraneus]MBE9466308.1 hypothetical protein [Dyadobacter subterraneus]
MTEEEVSQIGIASCRNSGAFIKTLGFDPTRSGLSTTEPSFMGVVLVQFPRNQADSASKKTYQDRSWAQYGWMGGITSDIDGNTYTAPLPKVNLLDNPLSQMNKIYKVDSETGVMAVLTELPKPDSVAGVMPFAVLGIYFDCHGKKLYASSVAGSTRDEEKGVIYVIDPENGDVVDKLEGHDAFAIFVGGITGEKRLYFGSTRSSDIYSIELTKSGKFKGDIRKECSLENLGPRGDDKARRIRFDENGNMMAFGVEFNDSLPAPSEKAETLYQFAFDRNAKKWVTIQGRQ